MVPERLTRLEERRLPCGLRLFVARSRRARLTGLMGIADLPAGCGLLLPGCDSVHTFWMRFGIDVLFVDRLGRVIEVRPGVSPRRLASHPGAAAVIEARHGEGPRFEAALTCGA